MKKPLLIAVIVAMIVLLLIYPEECLRGARNGLSLWFFTVLPSLFPFVLASFMLLETGFVRLIARFFAPFTRLLFAAPGESAYIFIAAALSGYPVGARLAAELYAAGRMSEADAQATVRFTSVSGPVFITGAVASGMLGIPEAGIYLAVAHYLGALFTGILFGLFRHKKAIRSSEIPVREALQCFRADASQCPPAGELMAQGVEKAMFLMLRIGGYILLFSVIMELLTQTGILGLLAAVYAPAARLMGVGSEGVSAMILGGLEMTTGCAKVASSGLPLSLSLPMLASVIGFGGMCVHMQTQAVCAAARLKLKGFILAKTLHGTLSGALCALCLWLFPLTATASTIAAETKSAAYGGVIFAAVTLLAVAVARFLLRRRSVFPVR